VRVCGHSRPGGCRVPLNSSAVSSQSELESLVDIDVTPRDPAFGMPLRKSDLALGALAVTGACAAVAIVATGGVAMKPTAYAAVLAANILTFAVGGLLWRHGRPSSAFGNLLLVEAFLLVVASLSGSPASALNLIGILGGWAVAVGATWLLLSFPGVRLRGSAWIVMGIATATVLLGELPLILVSPTVRDLAAMGRCTGICPANPALAFDAPNVAHTFGHVEAALQAAWATGLLVYLAAHFVRASQPRRRLVAPVLAASAPFVAAFAVKALLVDLAGVPTSSWVQAIFTGTRILFPLGFIAGLLFARAYAGEALVYMARRLAGRPPVAAVEQLVRRVLDDPEARLVFWLPRRKHYVDRHGVWVELDPACSGKTWRSFGHGNTRVLAIVHDPMLGEDPELVEAVGAASLLALDNRRLQQDLLDSVQALRTSQRRLVKAASAERRKIERDLHDGVQQKLVALRIQLELALDLIEAESVAGRRLAGLGARFDDALDDLRLVAHGIYPPLLSDEGLVPALHEAARRSSVPLTVDLQDVGRFPEEHEAAIYYCCLEALQNVAKHAGDDADATLRLWRDRRAVHFAVSDDGVGFVPSTHARGAGLTNMNDRMGAVGGALGVTSEPGEGTVVEGRITIDAGDRTGRDVVHV